MSGLTSPFGLSLSKAAPFFMMGEKGRAGLRQPRIRSGAERFWVGLGSAFALAACQYAPAANNQTVAAPANAAAPSDPLAVAERLVRARVQQRGEVRFTEARVRNHQGVAVVCGAYEQGGRQQRYIVVNGEDLFVEPEMSPGEMPRAINEFCAEGGRA